MDVDVETGHDVCVSSIVVQVGVRQDSPWCRKGWTSEKVSARLTVSVTKERHTFFCKWTTGESWNAKGLVSAELKGERKGCVCRHSPLQVISVPQMRREHAFWRFDGDLQRCRWLALL